METSLETYRRIVGEQPPCEDSWFPRALADARAGDDAARRRISGSCLRLALAAAEAHWHRHKEEDLFGIIQDANAALWDALEAFPGDQAGEFLRHAETMIGRRLGKSA